MNLLARSLREGYVIEGAAGHIALPKRVVEAAAAELEALSKRLSTLERKVHKDTQLLNFAEAAAKTAKYMPEEANLRATLSEMLKEHNAKSQSYATSSK